MTTDTPCSAGGWIAWKLAGNGWEDTPREKEEAQRDEPVILYVLADGVAGPGGPLEFKLWLAALHRRGSQDIHDYATVDGLTFVTLRYAPGTGIDREIAESRAFHEARRAGQDGRGPESATTDRTAKQGHEPDEA